MNFSFLTDVGKVRPHNEDNGTIMEKNGQLLVVVADGMGGHQAGDVASKMATELLKEAWEEASLSPSSQESEGWLRNQVLHVNESLYHYAQKHEECQGMGTTLVAAIVDKERVTIAHIGDSRAYLLNEHGFSQKTRDHSLVNELVRTGQISDEEAEHHPRKNVLLRALGTELDIKLDLTTFSWEPDDVLLLCSDGLSNKLSNEDFARYMSGTKEVNETAREMVQLANDRGGEDNITVALIKNTGSSSEDR
ncbi:Stp1/IreP family PP2C-type Ser/Thr phosphatase [Halalkalibacterium halodurans]|uniref:protein-serine/threonine phosphatase n=1 Tax=Halalkalibacterium halodurans (strain ATCC BAA-125 / DSM 18197 / FERM 7344 / JCM 9153 / C-125) TaxID=272558 RepID=Q9K9Y9_HALH5|nr:Stp1/IreP family PP2C-type Ser/Thr phosphatase [Halalkalibacterium halodurans]MED4171253.1 Stp1/IreP family PP2C-type Ser/Thr phosphatase [Halalkalibacterium halodurans]TES54521.1 Stp1/IreP family PP2C-type Ser/Thr phosphatase [Halalkalibacterium halodurans]BAB06224.1 BH2505 [Halalkalibacterium halodurans C-125]